MLLFKLITRVSAQMSFRTCQRRYALLGAAQFCSRVRRKIPNRSAAGWERQVEGLISDTAGRKPAARSTRGGGMLSIFGRLAGWDLTGNAPYEGGTRIRASAPGNDFNRMAPVASNLTNLPFAYDTDGPIVMNHDAISLRRDPRNAVLLQNTIESCAFQVPF